MTASETTLVLLKPDALERGLVGEILGRLERAGCRVGDIRRVTFTRPLLERHYAELKEKLPRAYARNARYLEGREGVALTVSGGNAIAKVRALVGPTDPSQAPPGTIRGDLSSDSISVADAADRGLLNLIHAADSPASAAREIALWFGRAGGRSRGGEQVARRRARSGGG